MGREGRERGRGRRGVDGAQRPLESAAQTGASIFKIQEISRHRSLQVLAGYVRDAQVYRDHAGSGFL